MLSSSSVFHYVSRESSIVVVDHKLLSILDEPLQWSLYENQVMMYESTHVTEQSKIENNNFTTMLLVAKPKVIVTLHLLHHE